MKTIKEYIEQYVSEGLTLPQARSLTAQQIILSKIAKSRFTDRVLLKGGVVMYNLTQEQRRTTLDLDFDFIRYDISNNKNLESFVKALNQKDPLYKVELIGEPIELHQQDYKGKRVNLLISDTTEKIRFKLDVGIHTLFALPQKRMCFAISNGDVATLLVNPPEQMFAEKLYSLAKIGPVSQRFKDIDDMYYLIRKCEMNKDMVRECLSLLTLNNAYGLNDVQDVIDGVFDCLNDDFFSDEYAASGGSWLNIDFQEAKKQIIDYIDLI